MATVGVKFPPIPNAPQAVALDPKSEVAKVEARWQQWAKQLVLALQRGTVEAPDATQTTIEVPASATVAQPEPTKPPSGAAGGDLSGTYPNPTVAKIGGLTPGNIITKNIGDFDPFGAAAAIATPSGIISQWAGLLAEIPGGFLLCDGTVYNIADYPILGGLLLAIYGGDGVTTFGVPDMRDRFALGPSSAEDPGVSGGTVQHKHSVGTLTNADESTHAHGAGTFVAAAQVFTGTLATAASTAATPDLVAPDTTGTGVSPQTTATGSNAASSVSGTSGAGSAHTHTISGKTDVNEDLAGSTATNDVLPPFVKLAFIIKT